MPTYVLHSFVLIILPTDIEAIEIITTTILNDSETSAFITDNNL
jgi:hypothetical protein